MMFVTNALAKIPFVEKSGVPIYRDFVVTHVSDVRQMAAIDLQIRNLTRNGAQNAFPSTKKKAKFIVQLVLDTHTTSQEDNVMTV